MRIFIVILFIIQVFIAVGQNSRIESEYKLDVPADISDDVWLFLSGDDFANGLDLGLPLNTITSEEVFVDVYYDDQASTLYDQEAGLRYRKRYVQDTLAKSLIQFKAALSEDGVARTETKYNVKKSKRKKDLVGRHDLLGLMKKRDRSDINYQLAKIGTSAMEMKESLAFMQIRQRVYIHDDKGALATITLDNVRLSSFPYHKFTEVEIELNEVRYTVAHPEMREWMDETNLKLRSYLKGSFASLKQDQTPKYNKMQNLINDSYLSMLSHHKAWLVLGSLVILAVLKLLYIR